MDKLMAHAEAEKKFSEHRKNDKSHKIMAAIGARCIYEDARNEAYKAYTGTPHPSTLGRGGSR